MHQLQLALDEDSELRAQLSELSWRIGENPLKHGLVLDLNPFWDAARRLESAGLSLDLLGDWWRMGRAPWSFVPPSPGLADLGRRYRAADDLTREVFGRRGRSTPFMLRVFAAPARKEEDLERRRRLAAAAAEAALPTIVQTEPRASFVFRPGDRLMGGGAVGTLGGYLQDGPRGPTYATTCGHVVGAGNVSTPAGRLGRCVYSHAPAPLPTHVPCTVGCGHVTRLDVALIDVGPGPVANVARTHATVVSRGDLVEMHGAITGRAVYEVGGTVVELDVAGSCWDRLYLLHAPTAGIFPVAVNVATHPLPQPGDSGAWLIRNGSEWAGMVVAKGGLHGYALPATVVLAEADQAFHTKLRLA